MGVPIEGHIPPRHVGKPPALAQSRTAVSTTGPSYIVMACKVMAYIFMAYLVMAYLVMTYMVMAYIVMAYKVMACVHKRLAHPKPVLHLFV